MTNLFSLQYLCHSDEVRLQNKYAQVLETLMERCFPQWRVTRTELRTDPFELAS